MGFADHVERWSRSAATLPTSGYASDWGLAVEKFSNWFHAEHAEFSREQWRAAASAWANLLSAAERATGPQGIEWLMSDLRLRTYLLKKMGPRPDMPLLDPATVLERALGAIPLSRAEAAELAPVWRTLPRDKMLVLRTARRLVVLAGRLGAMVEDHPRWAGCEAWREVAPDLP
ncbi:hypothetical protein AB0L71_06760 [Streptomyces sp. NPDC052052]|uniref:hypothetical protein n=1 Tax=Streptomyces sp. NPDC052052 TaxID=3154756 RepID=UPI00343B21C0